MIPFTNQTNSPASPDISVFPPQTTEKKENKVIINSQNVVLNKKEESLTNKLSEIIYYECAFCEKTEGLYTAQRKICEKLSGADYYCTNCLRHGFNTKLNKNILPLSFRAIPGYFYYELYLYAITRKMWIGEINDYIISHEMAGNLNPVFTYDQESMLWFIDFNKVGKGRKKIKLSDVMKTISNILVCFNLQDNIPTVKTAKLYEKYNEAITKFYTHRYRPNEKKLLIPTLSGCGVWDTNKKFNLENTRGFTSTKMAIAEK